MLVVSIPKSASTNLWISLAQATGLRRVSPKGYIVSKYCGQFERVSKLYSDSGVRSPKALLRWGNTRNGMYRKHILPIKQNIDVLSLVSEPIVVLLRNPEDILPSLARMFKDDKYLTDEKLLNELKEYYKIYSTHSLNGKVMRVHFEDLVLNWERWVKKICKWYDLPIEGVVENVHKRRYTGAGLQKLLEGNK